MDTVIAGVGDDIAYMSNLQLFLGRRWTFDRLVLSLSGMFSMIALVKCAICGLEGNVVLWTTHTRTRNLGEYEFSMKNVPTVWICDTHEM